MFEHSVFTGRAMGDNSREHQGAYSPECQGWDENFCEEKVCSNPGAILALRTVLCYIEPTP